ncbi:helix-turn-helix transcriptional regulator [Brevibacillus sp. SYSU BS000544]|uniref:helix-turn-helix transcriptional regulator n=1 Tax=Brevibacillus sp. SYSU BS000544 TaxID=3416443 RepID=UPI003CE4CCBA
MRVNRLLSMLLIISKKRLVTGKELSEHFEVSVRTIYRDIEKISEAGIPIASLGGKGGGYYIMENYSIDNLFLNKKEAQTFLSVMGNLNFLFGKNTVFNDIIMKFENTYKQKGKNTDKLTINMSHFHMENELKEYLSLMDHCIEESRLMIFEYWNRKMEYEERTVEPIQLSFSSGHWYLSAFCRNRNDYRRFKLVRVRNPRIGTEFNKRALTQAEINQIYRESYLRGSILVTLKFSKQIGEHLIEHFSRDCITQTEDDAFLVVDQFPYDDGLIKFILSFGKECEVLEPLYLREATQNYLEELVRKYND